MKNKKRIGSVPATIPADAPEEDEEEFVPFELDRDDSNQIALAKVIGWKRLEEMAREARLAAEQEEDYSSPVANPGKPPSKQRTQCGGGQ